MIINVKAKPDGYEDKVEKIDEAHFIVETREPPVNNRANAAITAMLARYFGAELGRIKMIKGHRERNKIFEINK